MKDSGVTRPINGTDLDTAFRLKVATCTRAIGQKVIIMVADACYSRMATMTASLVRIRDMGRASTCGTVEITTPANGCRA